MIAKTVMFRRLGNLEQGFLKGSVIDCTAPARYPGRVKAAVVLNDGGIDGSGGTVASWSQEDHCWNSRKASLNLFGFPRYTVVTIGLNQAVK